MKRVANDRLFVGRVGEIHYNALATDGVCLQMQENAAELRLKGCQVFPAGPMCPERVFWNWITKANR
jgi:hypothetical protein